MGLKASLEQDPGASGALTLRSEIQSELGSGHPAPSPLRCSFQKERVQGSRKNLAKSGFSCGSHSCLPRLENKSKKFKQAAPDLHSGAGNPIQVPREPPAQNQGVQGFS